MANCLAAVQTAAEKLSQVLKSARKENSDQLVTYLDTAAYWFNILSIMDEVSTKYLFTVCKISMMYICVCVCVCVCACAYLRACVCVSCSVPD